MTISQTPPLSPFPERAIDQSPGVSRYASIPTPETMKSDKLFGIPLTSSLTGASISDTTIQNYINKAISEIEHALDLYITPVRFKERHDYKWEFFAYSFAYLKLNHPNVLTIHKVELSFYNSDERPGFVEFPLEHVYLRSPEEGVIQLVPAFGSSFSGFLLSAFSGAQYHALRASGAGSEFPGAVGVEYEAGFEIGKVPALIVELIELNAAMQLLSMLGPTLFPYNSTSIGIDGTSQSVGGPGPRFLSDRLQQLQQEWDKKIDAAKSYYQRRWLIDYI